MRAARYLVPLAVVAALVAGCSSKNGGATAAPTTPAPTDNGVAALSATDIAAKALAALQNAPSVHVKGEVKTEGQSITLDMKMKKGGDGAGTMSLGGGTIEVTKIGGDIYLKADANFWKAFGGDKGDILATLLQGKYLKASASDPNFGEFAGFFDMSELFKNLGTLSKGETKVVNGQNAIEVVDNDPKEGGSLWVATQGEPYPLRMESNSDQGALDFTEYGATVDVTAPPADQVLDIAKLNQLGG